MPRVSKQTNDVFQKYLLFLINPILSLLYSCKNLNSKSSVIILILFSLVLSFSITVPDIRDDNFNFDAIAYKFHFDEYVGTSADYFKSNFNDYISFQGNSDFYADTIFYLVSRFTDNYHFAFLFIGIVFCYFQIKSLKILFKNRNYNNCLTSILLVFIFTINQIFNINAFRFYTALWVITYVVLSFFIEHNKKSLYLTLITPFIHGSCFIIIVIFILFKLFIKRYKLLVVFFISSFLLSSVSLSIFTSGVDILPDSLYLKYYAYVSESYMEEMNAKGTGAAWVIEMMELLAVLSVNLIAIFFVFKYRQNIRNQNSENLYRFFLFMLSFVNMTMIIPSLGARFMILLMPLVAYILIDCFAGSKWYNIIVYSYSSLLLLFFISPFNIYQFPCLSYYFAVIDKSFFINSPLITIYKMLVG